MYSSLRQHRHLSRAARFHRIVQKKKLKCCADGVSTRQLFVVTFVVKLIRCLRGNDCSLDCRIQRLDGTTRATDHPHRFVEHTNVRFVWFVYRSVSPEVVFVGVVGTLVRVRWCSVYSTCHIHVRISIATPVSVNCFVGELLFKKSYSIAFCHVRVGERFSWSVLHAGTLHLPACLHHQPQGTSLENTTARIGHNLLLQTSTRFAKRIYDESSVLTPIMLASLDEQP